MNFEYDANKVISGCEVIGIMRIKNKCCVNESVLVTKTKGYEIYSCQCGCGQWCTNGFLTIEEAIKSWKEMNR